MSLSKGKKNIQQLGWGASMRSNDGFAIVIRGKKHIFWDDALSVKRQRFAIAHELGHYINGNVGDIPTRRNCDPDDRDDKIERKANIVASRILAPPPKLLQFRGLFSLQTFIRLLYCKGNICMVN